MTDKLKDFTFYKSKDIYKEKYYQLPKIFFTNEKYKQLSNDSKIAYAILKDRFEYSIQNKWVDENDNIYFIFTVPQLMNILNCREGKISKIKKELEKTGLLYQKRGGFKKVNGIQINVPNLLYLGKPEVTAEDVFMINNEEASGIAKIANPSKEQEDNVSDGIAKIAIPSEVNDTNASNGIAKIADNLLDSFKDLDTLDTLDTKQAKEQILLDIFVEQSDNTVTQTLNRACLQTIATFSESVEEAEKTLGTIFRAKSIVQKETNVLLLFEDWEEKIHQTLRNVYYNLHKKKKNNKKVNVDAFIFTAMKNLFINCAYEIRNNENELQIEVDVSNAIKDLQYFNDVKQNN